VPSRAFKHGRQVVLVFQGNDVALFDLRGSIPKIIFHVPVPVLFPVSERRDTRERERATLSPRHYSI
jgi:hypothetical protein